MTSFAYRRTCLTSLRKQTRSTPSEGVGGPTPSGRAFAYLRISYDPHNQSDSPEVQRANIERVAGEVSDWFEDRDISGYLPRNRPGFQAMLDRLRDGDSIYVNEASRGSRRMGFIAPLLDEWADRGIVMFSVKESLNSRDHPYLLKMMFLNAENASAELSRRVRDKHRRDREQGIRTHPKRSYGFDYDKPTRTVTVNEDEATVVRAMAAAYLLGMGDSMIARALNDGSLLGFTPAPLRASSWSNVSVARLLSGPHVAGFLTHQGQRVTEEPTEPAILDVETFERLQAVRVTRWDGRRRPGRGDGQLLYGLARCGGCGGPLARHTGTRSEVYRCSRGFSRGQPCSEKASIRLPWLDQHVTDWFFAKVDEGALDAAQPAQETTENQELRTEVAKLRRAVERLQDAYALHGEMSRETFAEKMSDYETRLRVYQDKLDATQRRTVLAVDWRTTADLWPHMTLPLRREFLTAAIERVVVSGGGSRWVAPTLDRVQIIPR